LQQALAKSTREEYKRGGKSSRKRRWRVFPMKAAIWAMIGFGWFLGVVGNFAGGGAGS
jgi:hypothetical protein